MTSWPGFEEEEKTRMLIKPSYSYRDPYDHALSGILRTSLSSICLKTIFGVDPNYPRCLERQAQLLAMWRCQYQPNYHGSHEVDTGTESGKQCKDG